MLIGRQRLGELDLAARLEPAIPAWITQLAFGLVCAGAATLARLGVDMVTYAAGPYSLIYPAILISTLFGRWRSGVVTLVASFLYAWYVVLPTHNSFAFDDPGDLPRTVVNGVAATIILLFAEMFRRAVQRAVSEREAEIEARDLLLREVNHRIKNNFAIVASLLELQKQTHPNDDARAALTVASNRVRSFAAAHESLYTADADWTRVEMQEYLATLARQLEDALFQTGGVHLALHADRCLMPRDQAIAVGLLVNELVTNAAKHAFAGRDDGEIRVDFINGADGWKLTVADNGRGMPVDDAPARGSGLGSSLVSAFATKAGGALLVDSSPEGTRVSIVETPAPGGVAPD